MGVFDVIFGVEEVGRGRTPRQVSNLEQAVRSSVFHAILLEFQVAVTDIV